MPRLDAERIGLWRQFCGVSAMLQRRVDQTLIDVLVDQFASLATTLADTVDDADIRKTIISAHTQLGETICPHTACALAVLQRMRERGIKGDWAVVATAHPAKFPEVVEPLIGAEVPLPISLSGMLGKTSRAEALANDAETLRQSLRNW